MTLSYFLEYYLVDKTPAKILKADRGRDEAPPTLLAPLMDYLIYGGPTFPLLGPV